MRASNRSPAPQAAEPPIDWAQILIDAVNKPGIISTAYFAFWNYSVGNQLLALFECHRRGIDPGPIHTFAGWLKANRFVRKGERGITLCMPVSWTEPVDPEKNLQPGENLVDHQQVVIRRRFIYRPHWFVLSQTDGAQYQPLAIPQWEEGQALHTLMIDRVSFRTTDGNCQGYATERSFAVSPLAYLPHRTCLHEIAHIVLGHTQEQQGLVDGDERTPRDIREVEAEAVALICCQSLGLSGEEFSRGYLQHWLGRQKIEERSVHRIFKAAGAILSAGRPVTSDVGPDASI